MPEKSGGPTALSTDEDGMMGRMTDSSTSTPSGPPGPLTGRHLLITGAAGGLGPTVTAAARAAGARVTPWDRDHVDLLDAVAVAAAVATLVDHEGGLDGVCHLVGGYRGGVAFEDEPLEDFDLLIDLGIRTTVNVARATATALMASPHGRFLTVSAPVATRPSGQSAAYSIAKAGSDAAVLALADRFKGTGATANVVVVNAISTPAMREAEPDKDWSRFTMSEQIADTMVYVCSDAAGTMNGQHIRLVGAS